LNEASLDQTLEGLLYPDTYHVDRSKPIVPQLVRLQLQTFVKRVWPLLDGVVVASPSGETRLDWYDALILASIIEKEERVDANRDDIA
jgi:cell division protein YceG involved in septum cleavage